MKTLIPGALLAALAVGCGGGPPTTPRAPAAPSPPTGPMGSGAPDWLDWPFWNALAFDAYQCPEPGQCRNTTLRSVEFRALWILSSGDSTDFHIRTGRLMAPDTVRAAREAIRTAMMTLTGGFRGVITEGPERGTGATTITIEALPGGEFESRFGSFCAWAWIGRAPGNIYLHAGRISMRPTGNQCAPYPLLLHEIGHALGFYHVPAGNVMHRSARNETFTRIEEQHAQFAYRQQRGVPYPGFGGTTFALPPGPPRGAPVGVGCGASGL